MKKRLINLTLISLLSLSCNTFTLKDIKNNNALSYIADTIGNQNGYVSESEQRDLIKKIKNNDHFYLLTQGPDENFKLFVNEYTIYLSREELIKVNLDFKTKFGILEFNSKGEIIKAYSTSEDILKTWKEENIPGIDYKKEMIERRIDNHFREELTDSDNLA